MDKPMKTQKQKMPPIFMNQVIKGVEIRKASFKMKRHTIDTSNILHNESLQSMMHTTKNSFRAGNLADYGNVDLLPDINGEINSKFRSGDNYELAYNALPRIRRRAERKGTSTMFFKTMVDFAGTVKKQWNEGDS